MGGETDLPVLLYAFSVIFSVIPVVAVTLRFKARHMTRSPLLWDDWTILVALVRVAVGGMGQHLKIDVDGNPIYDDKFVIFQKTVFAVDISQLTALGPTKLSVLLLYRRIFGVHGRRFNIISKALITLTIAWTIAFLFTNIFQYEPVSGYWSKEPQNRVATQELTRMYLSQSYADVSLDVAIISLPVPLVWKLQMSFDRKVAISGIFLLGALTTAASIARTTIQYGVAREFETQNPDITYYLCPIVYWPLIESALGITAACLPMLRPIAQIQYIKHVLLAPAKTLSTIFTAMSGSQPPSHRHGSEEELDSMPPLVHNESRKADVWLKLYQNSALNETVDSENRVESVQMETPPGGLDGEGIVCQGEYGVSYRSRDALPGPE
ncbi:hypothetical protein EV127DRAFT_474986 [Xylaria flabelliformis]|nr:hypothetical protein EV127DRAFT_474986 [Xylaria flabelliformis]